MWTLVKKKWCSSGISIHLNYDWCIYKLPRGAVTGDKPSSGRHRCTREVAAAPDLIESYHATKRQRQHARICSSTTGCSIRGYREFRASPCTGDANSEIRCTFSHAVLVPCASERWNANFRSRKMSSCKRIRCSRWLKGPLSSSITSVRASSDVPSHSAFDR
jgi:hypothetical protein